MKYLFFIIIISLSLGSCRLDNLMFDSKKTTSYLLDDYNGFVYFKLDSTYTIKDSFVHLLSLNSVGAKISAIYIGDTNRINQDTVILYCHGNSTSMDYYWERTKLLANVGGKNNFGVLMMDYQGYGLSEGKSTEDNLYNDVDACMKWLKAKGLTDAKLIMYGFSMGGAPALQLTANKRTMQPSKLILESPFASMNFLSQNASRISMPSSYFFSLELNNAEEIKKVEEPFLWMHGINDSYVIIENGELISANYKGNYKVEKRIAGAEHSTIPLVMGFDRYSQTVLDFIRH